MLPKVCKLKGDVTSQSEVFFGLFGFLTEQRLQKLGRLLLYLLPSVILGSLLSLPPSSSSLSAAAAKLLQLVDYGF